jgi:hypothetical protein
LEHDALNDTLATLLSKRPADVTVRDADPVIADYMHYLRDKGELPSLDHAVARAFAFLKIAYIVTWVVVVAAMFLHEDKEAEKYKLKTIKQAVEGLLLVTLGGFVAWKYDITRAFVKPSTYVPTVDISLNDMLYIGICGFAALYMGLGELDAGKLAQRQFHSLSVWYSGEKRELHGADETHSESTKRLASA